MKLLVTIVAICALAVSAAAQSTEQSQQPKPNAAQAEKTPVTSDPNTLPDAPEPYTPLTGKQKFQHFMRRTYSPYTLGGVAFNATWAQMWGDWPSYGGGMQGWGKRFGASLADTETRSFFGYFLFPTFFKQDPRYFRSGKKGLIPRAWYAGTRVLVTRTDDNTQQWNYSEFAAVAATAALQNAYYPNRDRGATETFSRVVGSFGNDATSNLLREFWPDIKRVFKKHTPKKIKQMEQRIPGHTTLEDALQP